MVEWFREFFDELYYRSYRPREGEDRNRLEAGFIAEALGLPVGSRVVDVGCGYARHAVYLARMGYRVVCFDLSGYLLGVARRRIGDFGVVVDVVRGDMRWLGLRGGFDGAYLFYTSFGYFGDEGDRAVLAGVSGALRRGGRLLIDLWNPALLVYRAYVSGEKRRRWYEVGEYLVLEESVLDMSRGLIRVVRRFVGREDMKPRGVRRFEVRWYMPWEIEAMLGEAGVRVDRVYGDYRGSKFTVRSPRMIVLGTKR